VIVSAPAKINLFLAVTGRRPDGFHDLLSVAAPLEWGDALTVSPAGPLVRAPGSMASSRSAGAKESAGAAGAAPDRATGNLPSLTLSCDDPAVPSDSSNLVLVAARAFARATGWTDPVDFALTKRIPAGAGLGGGSSDAAAALRALNRLAGEPLNRGQLSAVAAEVGSDCPLFLWPGPVVLRGRGERVEPLAAAAVERLCGRSILVVKPGFGISTPWAYGRLVRGAPAAYLPGAEAEGRLADWLARPAAPLDELAFNSFEAVVFPKFAALPALQARLRDEFGLGLHLSGSGSAAYAFLPEAMDVAPVAAAVRAAWGASALVVATRITASSF
jgi:4-diphosphocytidyl-2-C-methyl-D-erythritol kinase